MAENHNHSIYSLLQQFYNKTGQLKLLGSCQDINYKVKCSESRSNFTLKVFSKNCKQQNIDFQLNLINYLKNNLPNTNILLPTFQQLVNSDQFYSSVEFENEQRFFCLLSFIDGIPFSSFQYLSPLVQTQFGELIGTICETLSHYQPEEASKEAKEEESGQWDLRNVFQEITKLKSTVQTLSNENITLFDEVVDSVKDIVGSNAPNLREQVVHGDLACYNLIATKNSNFQPSIIGIIDFGDASISWVVGELVIGLLSSFWHLKSAEECFLQAILVTKSFHSVFPLNHSELTCVWPLLLLRSIHIIYSLTYELQLQPDNEYNLEQLPMEWNVFRMIRQIDISLAVESFRSLSDSHSHPVDHHTVLLSPMIEILPSKQTVQSIDFTTKSPIYKNGNWFSETFLSEVDNHIVSHSKSLFVSRYGEVKLYATTVPSLVQPETISLFCDVFVSVGTPIRSPFDGILNYNPDTHLISLTTNEKNLIMFVRGVSLKKTCEEYEAVQFPRPVKSNEIIGEIFCESYSLPSCSVVLPPRLNVQLLSLSPNEQHQNRQQPPYFCSVEMFPYWNKICPSPESFVHSLLSSTSSSSSSSSREFVALNKRKNFVASVQEHYFKDPPHMVRGWKEFMYDSNGRGYLDMVNNVTVLGHCHPAVTNAAISQLHLLNTNSRFVYDDLGEYAEMILSTLPSNSKLKKVFFVNSGSEATDLALRIARTVVSERRKQKQQQGKPPVDGIYRDTICFEGGYHGITTASDEVSTTLNDNPIALESRPPWIHLTSMPNKFRGKYCQESNSLEKYVKDVETIIHKLDEKGTPVSAFIAEPLCGNSGGVELPFGYLKQVYELIHSAGGLCICDEVQVGYGRLGGSFWGFLEHGIEPDIITMAKATGNGYPLGFVITTEDISQEFSVVGSFFSSAGGSPLSCHIGKTVLQTIVEEKLQENSFEVGHYLNVELNKLKEKYPSIIGCIHGHGLYQGIEIIQTSSSSVDSTSTSIPLPGTSEAYKLCEYLLEHGVICHNTGDYSNVLKVKPPLVITRQSAEHFIKSFEITLQMLQNLN